MILQERPPGLGKRPLVANQVLGYRGLGDLNT